MELTLTDDYGSVVLLYRDDVGKLVFATTDEGEYTYISLPLSQLKALIEFLEQFLYFAKPQAA